jgi:hypothetical protein
VDPRERNCSHPGDRADLGVLWIRVIRVLLNRERWKVAKNLIYRLYKQEGLGLRKRPAGK